MSFFYFVTSFGSVMTLLASLNRNALTSHTSKRRNEMSAYGRANDETIRS